MRANLQDQWVFPGSTLNRVVDGDTFYADVKRTLDFGFHVKITPTATQKFRVNGCNAAPSKTASGMGATAALTDLLGRGPFTLASVGAYKYGDEWMAEVLLADGRRLTDVMIEEQWSAPWDGQGAQPLPVWPRTVRS
jgi:endonuclease YncB( thermonuclease family)